MAEDTALLDNVISSYRSVADWMSRLATGAFEITERVLMVGAVKYAAAALPATSPAKITLSNFAGLLQVILAFWLITRLWAVQAANYRPFYTITAVSNRQLVWAFRIIGFVAIVGFTWWTNKTTNNLVTEAVNAFATPGGH